MSAILNPNPETFNRAVWRQPRRVGLCLLCLLAALIVWVFPSTALQDLLLWGAFLFALARKQPLRRSVWFGFPGLLFAIGGGWALLHIPLSTSPAASARDFIRDADIFAVAVVLPALFDSRPALYRALVYTALAISLVIAVDAVRLLVCLGPNIVTAAHTFKPFLFAHPNNASMMAGAAALIWVCVLAGSWRQPLRAAACLLGLAVNLAYLWIAASRGPQLAFAVACGVSGFLLPGWRRKAVWLLVLLAAAIVLWTCAEKINRRFAEKQELRTFVDRTKVWQHTWQLAAARPLTGYGYGPRVFRAVYYASHPPASPHTFPHCHQYWLNLLFAQGWVGLLAMAAAWVALGVRLLRCVARETTGASRILPGMVLLLLVFLHAYNLGDLTQPPASYLLVWLVPVALLLDRQARVRIAVAGRVPGHQVQDVSRTSG